VAELETQVLDGKLEIDSLNASPVVSDEVDCVDCSVFLVDFIALRENHASKCEELDVLRVELTELQSRPTLLGACTSCPGLHEKNVELRSRIVSLEVDLKVPIPTSFSTCELHVVKNLELAQCVDHLQDENSKLREVLSWLSSQEPQLGVLIASYKSFDGWALGSVKFGVNSGEREGKFGNILVPPQPTPKDKFASKPNQLRENRVRRQVKRIVRNQVGSLVRSHVKSLTPSLSQDQSVSIVSFVERMVTRESFAIRERERREWLRSGQTRMGTTLLMVCLSLICHYLRERVLCIWFQHGEIGEPQVEAGLLAEDHRPDRSECPVRSVLCRVLESLVSVAVMLEGSAFSVIEQMVGILSLVVLSLLDVLHLVINTSLGEVTVLSLGGATNHAFPFVVLALLQ
jgi:hypothetical protein